LAEQFCVADKDAARLYEAVEPTFREGAPYTGATIRSKVIAAASVT